MRRTAPGCQVEISWNYCYRTVSNTLYIYIYNATANKIVDRLPWFCFSLFPRQMFFQINKFQLRMNLLRCIRSHLNSFGTGPSYIIRQKARRTVLEDASSHEFEWNSHGINIKNIDQHQRRYIETIRCGLRFAGIQELSSCIGYDRCVCVCWAISIEAWRKYGICCDKLACSSDVKEIDTAT